VQPRSRRRGWSVHTASLPPTGLKPLREYPNTHVDGFPRFRSDRADAKRRKRNFTLCFGDFKGGPTPGGLGLHPGA
jgi:hypothetical protein